MAEGGWARLNKNNAGRIEVAHEIDLGREMGLRLNRYGDNGQFMKGKLDLQLKDVVGFRVWANT